MAGRFQIGGPFLLHRFSFHTYFNNEIINDNSKICEVKINCLTSPTEDRKGGTIPLLQLHPAFLNKIHLVM